MINKSDIQLSAKNDFEILVKHPDWELSIDVTGGDKNLMVGTTGGLGCEIIQAGEYTFITTEAEHYKGASRHNHHLYLIDEKGKIKWSLPWKISTQIRMHKGNLVILRHLMLYHYEDPMLELYLVNDKNGKVVKQYPISHPETDKEIYERARSIWIKAELKNKSVNVHPFFPTSSSVKNKDLKFSWKLPFVLESKSS